MASTKTTSRRRRLRELPLKVGPATVRRVLRERRTRVRRGRTKRAAAILLSLALLAYGASPTDLVADTRPGVGLLDDLLVLPLGFWLVVLLLRRAQQERRLARQAAEGGAPGAAPPASPEKRRQDRLRDAVLIVGGSALGLAAGYLGQQIFPGAPGG